MRYLVPLGCSNSSALSYRTITDSKPSPPSCSREQKKTPPTALSLPPRAGRWSAAWAWANHAVTPFRALDVPRRLIDIIVASCVIHYRIRGWGIEWSCARFAAVRRQVCSFFQWFRLLSRPLPFLVRSCWPPSLFLLPFCQLDGLSPFSCSGQRSLVGLRNSKFARDRFSARWNGAGQRLTLKVRELIDLCHVGWYILIFRAGAHNLQFSRNRTVQKGRWKERRGQN